MFTSPEDSHKHSLETLELLYGHDDFMDSIKSVADVGCGKGLDIEWWATRETREEIPKPHNYDCYAIDWAPNTVKAGLPNNVTVIEGDFNKPVLEKRVDIIWAHDCFQYSTNPIATLRNWNSMMHENGMLILQVPQCVNIEHKRYAARTYSYQPFSYNITNLIYLLACNGFDCNDGMFIKTAGDPWIKCAVYKATEPLEVRDTSWYDLVETKLLPKSAVQGIDKYGYLRQEDIVTRWIDSRITEFGRA